MVKRLNTHINTLAKSHFDFALKRMLVLFTCLAIFSNSIVAQDQQAYFSHDTIHIGCEPDYPPYCMVDEDGKASGFSIDLFNAAADAAGLHVVTKIGIWNKIKHDLAEGRLDALPLVGRTPEREDMFDFTMPYLSLHGAVFVKKGTKDIQTLADLKGKEVVVMKGDNAEEFVRRDSLTDKIFTTKTYEQAFKELANGHYDALITQRITGINLLEELKIKSVEPLDLYIPEFRQDFCFAVQEGDSVLKARLNEGLSIIIADDTYDKIKEKWLGVADESGFKKQEIIRLALYIIVPGLLIIIGLWIFFLRREVKRQTQSLHDEIIKHKATLEDLNKQKAFLIEMERTSKTGGWEYDIHTERIAWTEGSYEIFGVTAEDYAPSDLNTNLDFYQGEHREIIKNAFFRLLDFEESYTHTLLIKTKSGERKWIKTMGKAETDNMGNIIRVFGNVVDVTEEKNNEIKLKRLTEELEKKVAGRTKELNQKVAYLNKSQTAMLYMVEDLNKRTEELNEERRKLEFSNKELEAFTYSVSHDLRAPLRAINGFSKFLLEDYASDLDDEGRRYIETIRNNAKKMDQLITDLLNLSRISRSKININKTDMAAVATSMFHEIATEEEKKAFEFILDDIPDAMVDISLIKQVWQNLISNALKYSTKSKTKRIEIRAVTEEDSIIYSVKDYGAGFDARYKHKLFGVFQRLHSDKDYKGTGVGLSIIKRIITRHGGEVWAEGDKNKGATFYFSIPKTQNSAKMNPTDNS